MRARWVLAFACVLFVVVIICVVVLAAKNHRSASEPSRHDTLVDLMVRDVRSVTPSGTIEVSLDRYTGCQFSDSAGLGAKRRLRLVKGSVSAAQSALAVGLTNLGWVATASLDGGKTFSRLDSSVRISAYAVDSRYVDVVASDASLVCP